MYRLGGSVIEEVDLVIDEFNEAAEVLDVTISAQLSVLRIALTQMAGAETKEDNYRRPSLTNESRPAKAERGDISRSAALKAARLLCPRSAG
jgi:hypothetical protein